MGILLQASAHSHSVCGGISSSDNLSLRCGQSPISRFVSTASLLACTTFFFSRQRRYKQL